MNLTRTSHREMAAGGLVATGNTLNRLLKCAILGERGPALLKHFHPFMVYLLAFRFIMITESE